MAKAIRDTQPKTPLPWGINRIGSPYHPDCHAGLPDGRYVLAVCEPHDMGRFRAAWWVLTGRAYAFLWPRPGDLEAIWKRDRPIMTKKPMPFRQAGASDWSKT